MKPVEIDVVAIFNRDKPPRPQMFKWQGQKYYVDYIGEIQEDTDNRGEFYRYYCRTNFGEKSHSVIEKVYEIRYYIHECTWILEWIND